MLAFIAHGEHLDAACCTRRSPSAGSACRNLLFSRRCRSSRCALSSCTGARSRAGATTDALHRCAWASSRCAYLGLGISLFPYVVPYAFTLWEAAADAQSQAFLLIGTLFLLPIILVLHGVVVLGVPRQGHGGHRLSLMPVSAAAQPLTADDTDLSPWWLRTVLRSCCCRLRRPDRLTTLAYRNAPPIPVQVVDAQGAASSRGDDIGEGQAVFLKYGLMANGSIWGHGGYLGPGFLRAIALHRSARIRRGDRPAATSACRWRPGAAQLAAVARRNGARSSRPTATTRRRGMLQLTEAQAAAYRRQIGHWTDYFREPALQRRAAARPDRPIRRAAPVRPRSSPGPPGLRWPSGPASRIPTPTTFRTTRSSATCPHRAPCCGARSAWCCCSAAWPLVLLAFGKFDYLGWISRERTHVAPAAAAGRVPAAGNARCEVFRDRRACCSWQQTLVGGAVAHYRAEPGDFYGFDLSAFLPSNLLRTWHLQTRHLLDRDRLCRRGAVRCVGAGRRRTEGPARAASTCSSARSSSSSSAACSANGPASCNLLGDCGSGSATRAGNTWRSGASGRYLLAAGLLFWFCAGVPRGAAAPGRTPTLRPLVDLLPDRRAARSRCSTCRPCSSAPDHFTIVDTWRFWIIHLWVEGFFEFFVTVIVAVIFLSARAGRGATRRCA